MNVRTPIALLVGAWLAARGGPASAQENPSTSVKQTHFEDDAPWPGRDKATPMRPDWCGTFPADKPEEQEGGGEFLEPADELIKGFAETLADTGFDDENLARIATLACQRPGDPAMQKQVARWRQRYLNLTGLTDKEDRQAMALRVAPGWDKAKEAYCGQPALRPTMNTATTSDPTVIFMAGRERALLQPYLDGGGCRDSVMARVDGPKITSALWWLDRGTLPTTEVARVVNLASCLDRGRTVDGIPDVASPDVMAAYAVCGADARRLDRARFDQEIAAAPYDDFARVHLRELFARVKTLNDYFAYVYWARAKTEPDVKAFVFDAPEAGWTAWEKEAVAHKDELAAIWAYEEKYYGDSKREKTGCSATLRANLVNYVQRGKATSVAAAQQLLMTSVGFAMGEWLLACDLKEGNWEEARADEELFKVRRVQRGPRVAAYWAAFEALQAIRADKEHYPIELAMLGPPPRSAVLDENSRAWASHVSYGSEAAGEIKSVTKAAGGVTVTFKKVTYKAVEDTCEETKKIIGVDASGSFVRERLCTITGYKDVDVTPAPLLVAADVADGLAAGQMGTFTTWVGDDKVARGMPVTIWADKAHKTLLVWNGVKL